MYDCEVIGGSYKKGNTKMNNRYKSDSKITVMYNKHIKKKLAVKKIKTCT